MTDDFIEKIVNNERFQKINSKQYAEALRIKYLNDVSEWYKMIIPSAAADELIHKTNNDYSEIWEEYCANCFKSIDKNTKEDCYMTQDEMTWLCSHCYMELCKGNNQL